MNISGRFWCWTTALLIAGSITCGARTGPQLAAGSATGTGGGPACLLDGMACDYTVPGHEECCPETYCFYDVCSPCGLPGAACLAGGPPCCPFLACSSANVCELDHSYSHLFSVDDELKSAEEHHSR